MAGTEVNRGDIWLLDLGMARKVRPAVVLSVRFLDHERVLVSYVPRTTSLRNTRFEIPHNGPGFKPGAFDAQSVGSVPVAKLVRFISTLNSTTLSKLEDAFRQWLGL